MAYYKDGIKLSNSLELNGMVVVNPTEEQIVAAGYTFKEDDIIVPVLSDLKAARIEESKYVLEAWLAENTLTSTCHGGVAAEYTVTESKQNQLVQTMLTYQIESQLGLAAEITWNAAGQCCEVWTYDELVQLSLEIKAFVKPRITKQREYEMQINAMTTIGAVQELEIQYDTI